MSFFYPWLLLLIPLPLLWRMLLMLIPALLRRFEKIFPRWEKVHHSVLIMPRFIHPDTTDQKSLSASKLSSGMILPWSLWTLVILALAQPLWVNQHQPLPMTGRDLMFLVDVSGSMRKMDFNWQQQPISRLDMVKRLASEFIEQRVGDRVGLILFGHKPYLRAPLSYDRRAISHLVKESEIALAGESTAIGEAIGLAIKRMQNLPSHSRVIVLLTDGANNEGMVNPRRAAELAALKGIKIYTIGMGKAQAPGPNPYGVWSDNAADNYEKAVLKALAKMTDGHFFQVLDSEGLQQAYAKLDQLEPAFNQNMKKYMATPLYPWPLALALILGGVALWKQWLPQMIAISKPDQENQSDD